MNLTLENIQHKFRECGLKSTPQRAAIYQALVHSTAHPTAEDLFAQGQRVLLAGVRVVVRPESAEVADGRRA